MYSLVKGYIQSRNRSKSEGHNVDAHEEEDHRKKLSRTASEPNDNVRFLSWDSVSFVTSQVKRQIDKGLHWIATYSEEEMAARGKRHKPEGTLEYTVVQSDNLAKIALKFDSTPSELARLNRLASHMLFPGQTLFVPEKKALSSEEPAVEDPKVITKAPEPIFGRQDSVGHKDEKNQNNSGTTEHEHEAIKLTKNILLDDDEEHISDHFLQIKSRYITDGQGIVSGVLLITPHSVMFQPNVSDPLVMDRGFDAYCISAQMSAITSAAMYHDIAAMAIHDPLKPGRFYLDAETAESLSRQNSSESENTPTYSPRCTPLNMIQEQDDNTMISDDLNTVVAKLLDDLITEIVSNKEPCKEKKKADHHLLMRNDIRTSSPVDDSSLVVHDISPSSEDSGITKALNKEELNSQCSRRNDQGKTHSMNDVAHNHADQNTTDMSEFVQHTGQLEGDISCDSGITEDGTAVDTSFFSTFSNEVKYWLGLQSQTREHITRKSEEELMPRPAAPSEDLPLYLCLRISKKDWSLCREKLKGPGADLMNRDQKRREYWFAIPHTRVEHVYQFFNKWCPSIHNATDADDDGSYEGELDEDADMAEEEGLSFDEQFYACTPPTHKIEVQEQMSKGSNTREMVPTSTLMKGHKVSVAFLDDFAPEMHNTSDILKDIHLKKLNKCLPTRAVGQEWELVYSTFCHGFSLKTLYNKMSKTDVYEDNPVLLVILDNQHSVSKNGGKSRQRSWLTIFGAVCSGPLHVSDSFYGNGESFLYKFEDGDELKIFRWSGVNDFYTKGDNDSIAFGGGSGNFGLWLDGDIYHGSSHKCTTYNNEPLSPQEDFLCSGLEVWTFV